MSNQYHYSGAELKEQLHIDWECFADKEDSPISWGDDTIISDSKQYITDSMLSEWSEVEVKQLIIVNNRLQMRHLMNTYMMEGFKYTQIKDQLTDGETGIQFTTKRYRKRYNPEDFDEVIFEGANEYE
ncbi:hypothetical protein [Jeotgalibaca porci]|uniref:hypothetical protein n=1 Tax=Jeotgalibaca porci TaxID=1868793 RepID=UPI0035A0DCBE